MPENPFTDRLGEGDVTDGPSIGTDDVPFFNIDDPKWGLVGAPVAAGADKPTHFWESSKLSIGQLPKHEGPPDTCAETCADKARVRAQKCSVLRKRVALALKEAGCPSKVSPHLKAKRTCKKVVVKKALPIPAAAKKKVGGICSTGVCTLK